MNIPDNDPKTYELLATGKTLGVFQLDSPLGRSYCKKLQPESLDHIAALSALLRPGCLESKDSEGISLTQHYINRKNLTEPITYLHQSLEPILKDTYGVMCYQENLMHIAQELAGFNLKEADDLRKGIGKKLPEEVAKVIKLFVEKATNKGIVNKEQAEEIGEWMRRSARYLFNASHAYAYGKLTYMTAYLKANDPLKFYCAWLKNAQEGQDGQERVADLVEDAKSFNVNIKPPIASLGQLDFSIFNGEVYFGLSNIKGIGEKQANKILSEIKIVEKKLDKFIDQFSVLDVIFGIGILPSKLSILFNVGYFREITDKRKHISYCIDNIFEVLDDKEIAWCKCNYIKYKNIIEVLNGLIEYKKAQPRLLKRIPKIESLIQLILKPTHDITDTITSLVRDETELLGTSLTCDILDKNQIFESTHTLKELQEAKIFPQNVWILVEIKNMREYTIKNGNSAGKNMLYLTIRDQTASVEAIMFPDEWLYYKEENILYNGCKVLVSVYPSKTNSLIIQKVKTI